MRTTNGIVTPSYCTICGQILSNYKFDVYGERVCIGCIDEGLAVMEDIA